MATSTGTFSDMRASTSAGAPIIDAQRHNGDGPGPKVMDAATLKGDAVVNGNGDHLGKIEAIMLDVSTGRVAYAVLSFGGFLGMGTKLFAIPWSALKLDAGEEHFILDIAKERLETAPGFDKDHWPSMADATWATNLHAYYNAKPYWAADLSSSRDLRTMDPANNNPKVY